MIVCVDDGERKERLRGGTGLVYIFPRTLSRPIQISENSENPGGRPCPSEIWTLKISEFRCSDLYCGNTIHGSCQRRLIENSPILSVPAGSVLKNRS